MSEITLFGPCAISESVFAAMAPHLKTEALRLMAERGMPAGAMCDATGATACELKTISAQSHRIILKTGEREASATRGKKSFGLSDSARLILLMMRDQAGTLAASVFSIGYDIGKSTSSVRDALSLLVGRGLIVLTAPSAGKNQPAQYRITREGEALCDTLSAMPEGENDDA
jgi:hypothetical protein